MEKQTILCNLIHMRIDRLAITRDVPRLEPVQDSIWQGESGSAVTMLISPTNAYGRPRYTVTWVGMVSTMRS